MLKPTVVQPGRTAQALLLGGVEATSRSNSLSPQPWQRAQSPLREQNHLRVGR